MKYSRFYCRKIRESQTMNLGILLAIGLLFTSVVTGDLDVLPLNTAVVHRYSYVFYCAKPVEAVSVNIAWMDPRARTIVSNSKSVKGYDVMYDLYRGHSTMKSVFSTMSHSGLYECRASYNELVHSGFGQLIVLDAYQLRCVQSVQTIVVEGDEIEAVCEIGYAGIWAPLLEWSGLSDDMKVANETDDTMARYRLSVPVHEGMNDRFKCTGKFDQPKYPLPENHAINNPIIKFKPCYAQTAQFIVHVPPTPERIRISPIKYYYDVGERITCDAETKPLPISIIWRDVNGVIISHRGQFSAGQPGEYNYTCDVTNVVGETKEAKTVTASRNFLFTVGPPTTIIALPESGVFVKCGRRRMVVTGGLAFGMLLHDGYSRAIMLAVTTWLGKETSLAMYTLPIWLIYFIFKRFNWDRL